MSFLFGNTKQKTPAALPANVKASELGTNQAALPAPVFAGIRKMGLTFVSDLYKNRAKKIQETVGSGKMKTKVTTGYNYYAAFAGLLCCGPVSGVRAIYANDEEIWSGTLNNDGASSVSITTTLGVLHLHWGNPNQVATPLLGQYPAGPMPAFRHYCIVVAEDFFFGESVSPPNLVFVLTRSLSHLTVASHSPADDALIPEFIYDLLVNRVYGAAVPAERLHKASFDAAAQKTLAEGLHASPFLDSTADLKSALADLLGYINGALVSVDGKIRLVLQRETDASAGTFGLDDLLEEPACERPSWSETWSETRVTFTDRERDFDSNVATYTDMANAAIAGPTQKEFQRPHITDGAVAAKIAAAIGSQAGTPAAKAKLVLQPTANIAPGDHFALSYPPLGILSLPLICNAVNVGPPDNPRVEVEASEDLSRVGESVFVADPPPVVVVPSPGPADAFFRIAALPEGLKDGLPDGMLAAIARPNEAVIGGTLYTNWSLQETWKPVADVGAFVLAATVLRWKPNGANFWILDVQLNSSTDADMLSLWRDQLTAVHAATCLRTIASAGDAGTHGVESAWFLLRPGGRFAPIAEGRWEIEVAGGQFGSQNLAEFVPEIPGVPGSPGIGEAGDPDYVPPVDPIPPVPAVPGNYPCATLFLGRLEDFTLLPSDVYFFERFGGNAPQDATSQIRYVRIPTHTPTQAQELGTAPTQRFERLNPAMNPGGTLVDNWGEAVAPAAW